MAVNATRGLSVEDNGLVSAEVLRARFAHDTAALELARREAATAIAALSAVLESGSPHDLATVARSTMSAVGLLWEAAARVADGT